MSYRISSYAHEQPENGNYLVRHWRGQLSLPVSYWLNSVLLALVLSLIALWLVGIAETSGMSLRALSGIYLAYLIWAGLLWLWSIVGVWRSADRHEERGGSPGWATTARIVIIFGAFAAFAQSSDRALGALEYAQLAMGNDPMGPPAQMTIDPAQKSVLVEGSISLGTADRFDAILKQRSDLRTVLLQSDGGRTFEAQQMAKAIAARGLDTDVKRDCLSACTLILLAGRQRSATPTAKIGFHQPTFPGLSPEAQQFATSELRSLYEQAGVKPAFLDNALRTPPDRMWYPSHSELIEGNVLNATMIVSSKNALEMRKAQLAGYLKYSADQLNAQGSVRLDDATMRTGALATANVLTILLKLEVSRQALDIPAGKRELYAIVKKETCADRPTRQAIRAGAVMVYSYRDRNGQHLFDLRVDECELS